MKKIVSLIVVSFLIAGCSVKGDIKKSVKKTDVSKEMNGYQVDLRIKGKHNDKQVNEIVRITNYMDKQFKIVNNRSRIDGGDDKSTESYILILNNKTYKITDNKSEVVKEDVAYGDPKVYLNILRNLTSGKENRTEKSGDVTYKVYNVIVTKDVMKTALKGSAIEDITFVNDVEGEVWINPSNYVYKVVYYLNKATGKEELLQMTTSFFSYNNVKEMSLPKEGPSRDINRPNRKSEKEKI